MQRKILFGLLLTCFLTSLELCGQSYTSYNPSKSKAAIGKLDSSKMSINVDQYDFGNFIYKLNIDSVYERITLELREKTKNGKKWKDFGQILQYGLTQERTLWKQARNYASESYVVSEKSFVIKNDKTSSKNDIKTGKTTWIAKGNVFYLNDSTNYALAIRQNKNELVALNATNGKDVWKKKISLEFGIRDIQIVENSLFIIADKLYIYNIQTGQVKAHPVDNYKRGFSGQYNKSSGLLQKDNKIIYAVSDQIESLNWNGTKNWKIKYDQNTGSSSSLEIRGDTLYHINLGYVLAGGYGGRKNFGQPFIAAYDINTGTQFYNVNISGLEWINTYSIDEDYFYLTNNYTIVIINKKTGRAERTGTIPLSKGERFLYLTDEKVYIKEDDFIDLNKVYGDLFYMVSSMGKIYGINSKMKVQRILDLGKDVHLSIYQSPEGFTYVSDFKSINVLDSSGKSVASFNTEFIVEVNDRLFCKKGSKLQIVEAKQIDKILMKQ